MTRNIQWCYIPRYSTNYEGLSIQLRVLSKEDLVRIHQLTQKVIENKGCRGSGKDTRPRNLSAFFPGLSYAGPLDVKPGETHYIYDFEANRSLDCTETDIADKLLVLDNSLTNIEYDCCNLFTPLGRGSVHRWSRLTTRARPAKCSAAVGAAFFTVSKGFHSVYATPAKKNPG